MCDDRLSRINPVHRRTTTAAFVVAVLCLFAGAVQAQPYLFDTGPGGTSTIGALSLFAAGATNCSPQPQCGAHFQFLAAQFTLTQAASISSIEVWLGPFGTGGAMTIKIRENVNGLPGTNGPPLFSPNSIYSKSYPVADTGGTAHWVVFPQYEAVLAAGVYWLTFEPDSGSGMNVSMPGGAASPLPKYAYFDDGNSGYFAQNPNPGLGVRIAGTAFPGVAFGTATRTILIGSTFGGQYNYDFIRAGARDFVPNGVQGPALTSTYVFVTPGGYSHARGKLFANGLSAGAYAVTDGNCSPPSACSASSQGAGRGVAYRTFINMSDTARTFRVNAILHGELQRQGKRAFGGVYVFDSGAFSAALGASASPAEQFLLTRDAVTRLADGSASDLSLDTLFPPAALLAKSVALVTTPFDQPIDTPLSTDLITITPQQAITVMFDVAAYAPPGGASNFGDTLSPAPNFITDASGAPVPEIVAVGPSVADVAAPTSLTLAPASITSQLGTTQSFTTTATTAAGAPTPDVAVTFTVTSGPNAGLTATTSTDTNGEATFSYGSALLGADSIQASTGSLQSNVVADTWMPGALDHITIAPTASTIGSGGSQAYTAAGFDFFNNSLGDVTSATAFSIVPDGSCSGASCTATAAGAHTVTATYNGKTATASLTVTGGGGAFPFRGFFWPINNPPVVNVVKAGNTVPVSFSLGGSRGINIFAPGYPASQPAQCVAGAPSDPVEITLPPGASGLIYDRFTGLYIYFLKTQKTWANTCRQLNVKLSDGTSHMVNFRFTK